MDESRFDAWTQSLSAAAPRRAVLAVLATAGLGLALAHHPGGTTAKKRKSKLKRNEFGCVNVGNFCKHAGQCCSGVCKGKKGQKRCKAHGAGGCTAGHTIPPCGGVSEMCITSSGEQGSCGTTTGNAGYCVGDSSDEPCQKDADCRHGYGPPAACVLCPNSPTGRRCAGPTE